MTYDANSTITGMDTNITWAVKKIATTPLKITKKPRVIKK